MSSSGFVLARRMPDTLLGAIGEQIGQRFRFEPQRGPHSLLPDVFIFSALHAEIIERILRIANCWSTASRGHYADIETMRS